jgi:hypothetical protein
MEMLRGILRKGYRMWTRRSIMEAPEGIEVMSKIDDQDGTRNKQKLIRKGRLWFYPDMSMYVYYEPTHWKTIVTSKS